MLIDHELDGATLDFCYSVFDDLFTDEFRRQIPERRDRDRVVRQIEETAAAASQALAVFLASQSVTADDAKVILEPLQPILQRIGYGKFVSTWQSSDALAQIVIDALGAEDQSDNRTNQLRREAARTICLVLKTAGPILAEWKRCKFATTFEPPKQLVARLEKTAGHARGTTKTRMVSDANYTFEIAYRDAIYQRYYRVDADTVRMSTNLTVEIGRLFIMPRVHLLAELRARDTEMEPDKRRVGRRASHDDTGLLTIDSARERHRKRSTRPAPRTALDLILKEPKVCIIGPPGCGKSTFLTWLLLEVAIPGVPLTIGGQQALPIPLKVRELDAGNLPDGPALIKHALASPDRAQLMPDGWIARYLNSGRVLFMIDGIDEFDPEARAQRLVPWLQELFKKYQTCRFLLTSRPQAVSDPWLSSLGFVEAVIDDFSVDEIKQYVCNWCIAVLLASGHEEDEANRIGMDQAGIISDGFINHPEIADLARNPLMLSAICLVNRFEGGRLPEDRGMLYRLCVEGLLHKWDERRGLRSPFRLEDKLRFCREVAIAAQEAARAETALPDLLAIGTQVFGDQCTAERFVAYVCERSGLLIEKRPEVFSFAHLTFQEYFAASALLEGNERNLLATSVVAEQLSGRSSFTSQWIEVLSLYVVIAPEREARAIMNGIISSDDRQRDVHLLLTLYVSLSRRLSGDLSLRRSVIAAAMNGGNHNPLVDFPSIFSIDELVPFALAAAGMERPDVYCWTFFRKNPHLATPSVIISMGRCKEDVSGFALALVSARQCSVDQLGAILPVIDECLDRPGDILHRWLWEMLLVPDVLYLVGRRRSEDDRLRAKYLEHKLISAVFRGLAITTDQYFEVFSSGLEAVFVGIGVPTPIALSLPESMPEQTRELADALGSVLTRRRRLRETGGQVWQALEQLHKDLVARMTVETPRI